MIILIGSEKGGVGKSTLATNLSALLATQNKNVMLVDADRQSTSANWAQDRQATELPKVSCVRQYDNIKETLLTLKPLFDYVVVDCQGRDSRELRTGLLAADIAVTPFRPSQWDLDTLPYMMQVLNEARDYNSNLKSFAIITMSPTNPQINELKQAQDYFAAYPAIALLNTIINDRKAYRDAASMGRGVVELDNEKATDEITRFTQEILQ